MLFVHFNRMKKDLQGEMLRIAAHLEVDVDRSLLPTMVKACTFEEMHKNAASVAPLNGALWTGGGESFVFKGTNSRWVGVLSDEQVERYLAKAQKDVPEACARWLESGDLGGDFAVAGA